MSKENTTTTTAINTTTTQFNRSNVTAILDECREALAPIAEKYGLTLDRKGRTYHTDALPVMFQFLPKKTFEDGTVLTATAQDFLRYAPLNGLQASDLGKLFSIQGETYKITGWKPKSRKYPILAKKVLTGKTYKFGTFQVLSSLKRAA